MLINSNFAVTLLHLQDCYTSGIKKANIAVTTFCSSRSHWDEGYWSGMSKNISSYKANCGTCIIYVPSQQREPLTLDIPKSTAVADGKQVLFSKGDSSRQAPATHLHHTHLFWPCSGIPCSTSLILVPTVQNKQGYHLGKWRGHTLRIFRVTAVQS